MKKFLLLFLCVSLLFTFSACKKNDVEQSQEPTTTIVEEEDFVYQEPQYHTKLFNHKMILTQLENTAIVPHALESFKELKAAMDKGIIDTYAVGGGCYILTPEKICYANGTTTIDIYEFDRKKNVTIAYADLQLLVLQNKKGEYSFYKFDFDAMTYLEFEIENFAPLSNDLIRGDSDLDGNMLHIVKNINKEGISVQTFKIKMDYSVNKIVVSESTNTFKFNVPFESEIKEYAVATSRENLNGLALLENGNAYYVHSIFNASADDKLIVADAPITNVEKIIPTSSYLDFLVIKNGDSDNLYNYSFISDSEGIKTYESIFVLKNANIQTKDIINTYGFPFSSAETTIFETKDSFYKYQYGEWEKLDEMTRFVGKNQIKQYCNFYFDNFIMNDGHLYSLIDTSLNVDYEIIE